MKLRYDLEFVDMGEEIICVPIGEGAAEVRGVLKVNKEGQEIIRMLSQDTSPEDIVDQLSQKYDNKPGLLREYVDKVIANLRSAQLIVE